MARWRKDALALAVITAPFALLIAGLLVAGELAGGGWAALDYLVFALAAGALWAIAAIGYLLWVVIRDGWAASSAPAIVVLGAAALFAALWGYLEYVEDRDCRAAHGLYERLAAMPAAQRAAAIHAERRHVREPSPCALDALLLAFGRDPAPPAAGARIPDHERLAVLAELLQAGLPPVDRLLHSSAVEDADADVSRLLLRRRKALNEEAGTYWELFPDAVVQPLIASARTVPGTTPDATALRYRATLRVFVEEGLPDRSALSDRTWQWLGELGLLP